MKLLGNINTLRWATDLPFQELDDNINIFGRIREIFILDYDDNSRVTISLNNKIFSIKSGYIYPTISIKEEELNHVNLSTEKRWFTDVCIEELGDYEFRVCPLRECFILENSGLGLVTISVHGVIRQISNNKIYSADVGMIKHKLLQKYCIKNLEEYNRMR